MKGSEDLTMRFKILTNFVNAYKDKMFLSNKPGKDEQTNASFDS